MGKWMGARYLGVQTLTCLSSAAAEDSEDGIILNFNFHIWASIVCLIPLSSKKQFTPSPSPSRNYQENECAFDRPHRRIFHPFLRFIENDKYMDFIHCRVLGRKRNSLTLALALALTFTISPCCGDELKKNLWISSKECATATETYICRIRLMNIWYTKR